MPLTPLLAELEQNIANDISVDRLAEAGLLSRSQLYREFYDTTGHSVKEYVRKRRLSTALALIKHTDTPLLDIAHQCGFGSQQALCRSVKAATGLTPTRYKASGDEYYFPICESQPDFTVTISTETIPATQRLLYYDSRLKGLEDRALAWLLAARPGYRGRIFGRNGQQRGSKLCYELYIESDHPDQPAFTGTFAKTSCSNIELEINAAWDYLYDDWLKTSMFSMADAPYFEEYIHGSGQVKRLQLYLPVQKRPGFHKIQLCQCGDMHFLAARRSGKDAETIASKAVMDFLTAEHPRLAQSARQFYVSTAQEEKPGLRLVQKNIYACGIALQAAIDAPPGLEIITHPAGEYALLEGDCCGDAGVYASVLAAWMGDMGLAPAAAPFAVYEASGGFDERDIRAKIYVRIAKGVQRDL
ncbi:MAG: helix-turn-helix domain-containing protein [Oscillospiraceae bacterium]|nr:helix-turn-helix domain-containing protein [Oscillospiraceae bacterium]